MFWKGPVFTKDGFRNRTINLENCEVVEGGDGEEDGIIVPLFRNCHTHLGDTLARDTVLSNSSGNTSKINFNSGGSSTLSVFCTMPASKTVYLDSSGNPVGAASAGFALAMAVAL